MTKVLTNKTKIYPWIKIGNINFRGYFVLDNFLYRNESAIKVLQKMLKEKHLNEILPLLNGIFSIVIDTGDEVQFAVDRMRSLPLFYSIKDKIIIISNIAENIFNNLEKVNLDVVSLEEFEITERFVTGSSTLYKEIKQVQAGEIVIYNKKYNKLTKQFYFKHSTDLVSKESLKKQREEFEDIFKIVSNNMVTTLDGRTAVVPLTGGVDSRELLVMLDLVEYKNVICYTCGKYGSKERKIAKELAEYFGYRWIGIDYSKKKWKDFSRSSELIEYREFANNFTSLPHILEILAVKELIEKQLIPKNSVFLPGHAGAIVGGRLQKDFLNIESISFNEFKKIIKREFYQNKNLSSKLEEKISSNFTCENINNRQLEAQFHNFEMIERQSKFICNSVRVYEYFGYEWILPLCDLEFLNFMKKVPLELKKNKKFIRDFIGLNVIESTADDTTYKKISNIIRKKTLSRIIIRKASKLIKYYSDPLLVGGLYGKYQYFKESLKGNEYFSSNTLECIAFLKLVKGKSVKSEK